MKDVSMNLYTRRVFSASLMAMLQSGCNLFGADIQPEPIAVTPIIPVEKEPEQFIMHKVMPDETLVCIAKWYSGSENQWASIVAYNPGINPKNLLVNDVLKIPLDIATSHKEQSRTSLGSLCLANKKHVRIKTPSVNSPSTLETIGPK